MRRWVAVGAGLALAGSAVSVGAGLASGAGSSRRDAGVVGAIYLHAGPFPADKHRSGPESGRVRVLDNGKVVAEQQVRKGHRYHFQLVPDEYRIVAKSGFARCQPKKVVAVADRTVRANVNCGEP